MALTPKQEKFAQLYVKYGHATKAYLEAYPVSRDWKESSVNVEASKSLNKPKIAERIKELQDRLSSALDITPDRVLKELARIAFANLQNVLDENGTLLPQKDWPKDTAPAIQSIKIKQTSHGDQVAEVKLWPKTAALESLSKHLGLFERDNRQKDIPINLTVTYQEPKNAGD